MSTKRGVILLSILMALALTLALTQPTPAEIMDYGKAIGIGYIKQSVCDGAEPFAFFRFQVQQDKKGNFKGDFQLADVTCPKTNPCFYIHVKNITFVEFNISPGDVRQVYFRGETDDYRVYVLAQDYDNAPAYPDYPDLMYIHVQDKDTGEWPCVYDWQEVFGDISVSAKSID